MIGEDHRTRINIVLVHRCPTLVTKSGIIGLSSVLERISGATWKMHDGWSCDIGSYAVIVGGI